MIYQTNIKRREKRSEPKEFMPMHIIKMNSPPIGNPLITRTQNWEKNERVCLGEARVTALLIPSSVLLSLIKLIFLSVRGRGFLKTTSSRNHKAGTNIFKWDTSIKLSYDLFIAFQLRDVSLMKNWQPSR